MPIIKKGDNFLHNLTNEFVTISLITSERVFYQDNMGVKGSLPIEVFLSTFRECKSD